MYFIIIKRSLLASFFILLTAFSARICALENLDKLANSSGWRALLHTADKKSAITDPNFLLSSPSFSLLKELKLTINQLKTNKQSFCQYPARALWLANENIISGVDFSHCKELTEYLTKVPVDDLYLVFSAENLAQPSSMMGHILLKTEGQLSNGEQVQYGMTYFTKIDSLNLPKTIYQTMVSGSQGFFTLSPYEEHLERYLVAEQRNVWEYQLDISHFHKYLIQLHLWELKSKDIKYFFVEYNCATLINFVLGLSSKELLENKALWLTPLDVVKAVNNNNLVKSTKILASADWKIRMLSDSIKAATPAQLVKEFNLSETLPENKISNTERFLQLELLSSYYDFELENKRLSIEQHKVKTNKINQLRSDLPQYSIELSNYKLPTKTPNDSKVSLQYVNNENNSIRLRFTPASHHISDDNRQYFAESELNLGEITLSYDDNNKLELHRFNLYSMTTLTPYHPLTGGISGGFHINYQQQNTNLLDVKGFSEFGGELGITKKIGQDIYLYALGELSVATDLTQIFITGAPKLGMIIYEIFDMKSVIEFSHIYNSANLNFNYTQLNWQQSWFINKDWQIELNYLRKESKSDFNNEVGFSLQRHF